VLNDAGLCKSLLIEYANITPRLRQSLLQTVEHVRGPILWANTHLLFWLSLIPFATAWMGENQFAVLPTALYGAALLMAAIAYYLLQQAIIREHGRQAVLAQALGRDFKGKVSPILYLAGILLAWVHPWISDAIYAGVALMWLIPDRRIEKRIDVTGH
jgi:uncharacterized membrane protein